MLTVSTHAAEAISRSLLERNGVSRAFFDREAPRLAVACREMAERFSRGARLLAVGRAQYGTDAQHVTVEFVHPVIVGKRALPALDLSSAPRSVLPALLRPEDIVMGFAPPAGDPELTSLVAEARRAGAQTFALSGPEGDYKIWNHAHGKIWDHAHGAVWKDVAPADPFVHQELIEILYHTLWETVHVFLEHRHHGHELGAAAFLYPYLDSTAQDTSTLLRSVAESIRAKAETDERLRADAAGAARTIAEAAALIRQRIAAGATIFTFGNGGSATDANDFALDCCAPVKTVRPLPAISLSSEPATITALANDIGREVIFLRQLIAHGRPGDVAVAISTSGGSGNVIAALEEARRRGMLTVALLGYDGGEIVRRQLADVPLVVQCDYIPRIQEVQASIYHVLIDALQAA
jgi:D-sedoheptulose 7-phosphate isomerase